MLSRPVSGGKSNHDQSSPWWFPPELSQMIRCQAEYNRAVQIVTKAARVPETVYAMLRSTSTTAPPTPAPSSTPTADPGPVPPPTPTTPPTPPTATADPGPAPTPAPSSTPPPTATAPPTPPTPPTRKRRSSLNSAAINLAVADWLRQHATDPFEVRIRTVARAVGVSLGAVAGSAAWRAFNAQRRKLRPKAKREVPLTDGLLAVLPALPARDRTDELEQLIREQEADRRRDERRSRRSGRCS